MTRTVLPLTPDTWAPFQGSIRREWYAERATWHGRRMVAAWNAGDGKRFARHRQARAEYRAMLAEMGHQGTGEGR